MKKKFAYSLAISVLTFISTQGALAQQSEDGDSISINFNGWANKLTLDPKHSFDLYGISNPANDNYGIGGKVKLAPFKEASADKDASVFASWAEQDILVWRTLRLHPELEVSANARPIQGRFQLDQGKVKLGKVGLFAVDLLGITRAPVVSGYHASASAGEICGIAETDESLSYHAVGVDFSYLKAQASGILSMGRGGALIGRGNVDIGRRIGSTEFEGNSIGSQARKVWGIEAGYQLPMGAMGVSCGYQSESTGPMISRSVTAKLEFPQSGISTSASYVSRSTDANSVNQVRIGVALTR